MEPTQRINVEELKQLLLARKTTKAHFKLPMPQADAEQVLTAAYMAECEYRGHACNLDGATASNIRKVASLLTEERPKQGIMFCGICGNGKTTMLYALRSIISWLNSQNALPKLANGGDSNLVIQDARELTSIGADADKMRAIKQKPLLAIEDMGREPTEVMSYGNVYNPVIELLEYRYDNQLFTAITTNLTPADIRETYGNRIADRFNEMMNVLIFKQGTYRK